jgi:hypothetical protein
MGIGGQVVLIRAQLIRRGHHAPVCAARTETPEGTDCQTVSIVEATSLDVISAGQLPDRRSRRVRTLRLVRPDRRRCAGYPSPRLSVCVGPFGQDEPYDGGHQATTGLSTNLPGRPDVSSTKQTRVLTECGNTVDGNVLARAPAQPPWDQNGPTRAGPRSERRSNHSTGGAARSGWRGEAAGGGGAALIGPISAGLIQPALSAAQAAIRTLGQRWSCSRTLGFSRYGALRPSKPLGQSARLISPGPAPAAEVRPPGTPSTTTQGNRNGPAGAGPWKGSRRRCGVNRCRGVPR